MIVDKSQLRDQMRAARARLTEPDRAAAARALRDAVLELPQTAMAGTVAAYYSVGTEPGSRSLVYALWKRGTYVLLPVLTAEGDLDWASYEGPESLVPGPRRLLEPSEPGRGVAAIARADLVIVPALAVDQAGNRLGRGAGCYDRALARVAPQIPVIALLYDHELIPEIPTEPHDRPITAVARPTHAITNLPS